MSTVNMLYRTEFAIGDFIKVIIPFVGDVIDQQDEYYNLVNIITSMPIDLMAQLDEAGIDFTKINDWDLFIILFPVIAQQDTSLIFGDLDLTKFDMDRLDDGKVVLRNKENGAIIDRATHRQIANVLRKIHHLEKNRRKPANQEAKEYMLERAKEKLRRKSKRAIDSQLESLIVAMVNTEQFKYDYDSVRGITIYQFNESVKQIINKVDYEHRMNGVYAGTVDVKSLSQDDLNWLSYKKK